MRDRIFVIRFRRTPPRDRGRDGRSERWFGPGVVRLRLSHSLPVWICSQAGIFFLATRMVASRSGTGVAQSNSANGHPFGGRGVSQDPSADRTMTSTRDRRVSQRAVDGQQRPSTSNRVPLSSAARHLGLSPAVSATRAPSAPLEGPRFFPGGWNGTARLRGRAPRAWVATSSGDAAVFKRVLARLGQTYSRKSAQSKFAQPALDDDVLHPGLRDELLLLRSDNTEDQSMLVVVLAGGC